MDTFWAKTDEEGRPGISVFDHCVNVGCMAEAIVRGLPEPVRKMLPGGVATLAALHDVGKITLGFQIKCEAWRRAAGLTGRLLAEASYSVSDHALVSQAFLQQHYLRGVASLWAVAIGSHHGRVKGRNVRIGLEAQNVWAEAQRKDVTDRLIEIFGALPTEEPCEHIAPALDSLWLLAGLITFADWMGSNEIYFSPISGLTVEEARNASRVALNDINWPGPTLRNTEFAAAFATAGKPGFTPNSLQQAVAEAATTPGLIVVEGPMGCGKTEAALFAAQQLISSGHQQGLYFALPTQVTSNRIHLRVAKFLENTMAGEGHIRLTHSNAWLEDDFVLLIRPSIRESGDEGAETVREARSWFASAKQALLAPYGVGTVDQALMGVIAVKHFFLRRFALAGKVVILDEVHAYDIYTGTLISALVRELINLSCTVIVLSATLTAGRRRELLAAAGVREEAVPSSYPLVTTGSKGGVALHSKPEWSRGRVVRLRVGDISDEETAQVLVERAEAGQHVLWIRNTVADAQQSCRLLRSQVREGAAEVGLLHGRFLFNHRKELEDIWLERLGRNRVEGRGSLLVATQIVEQSVDIDLDFIVSDLAPTDMLLQRMGRLWRHERLIRKADRPEFWIRVLTIPCDAGASKLKKMLGRSARVYAPYVLLRTTSVFAGLSAIELPAGIRSVLEATYADPAENEPEAWRELYEELLRGKAVESAKAEAATRVLANPAVEDEEGLLTRRSGPPMVNLVLLREINRLPSGDWRLRALDDTGFDISDFEWRRDAAQFLNRWMVRTPKYMVPAGPRPLWLGLHMHGDAAYALVGREDNRCTFPGAEECRYTVTYRGDLGIFAERSAATSSEWEHDDEFDR